MRHWRGRSNPKVNFFSHAKVLETETALVDALIIFKEAHFERSENEKLLYVSLHFIPLCPFQ